MTREEPAGDTGAALDTSLDSPHLQVKMAPQLYLTVYNEQFASPGKVKRVQLRPTSAHRRNNPQPPPDFLFPRNVKSSCRYTLSPPHPRGPLFPPVRHLSSHGPVRTGPERTGPLSSSDTIKPPSSVEALPSVGGHKKLQFTEPPASELSWKPPRRVDPLSRSLPAQQIQLNAAGRRLTRPQTTLQRHFTSSPLRSGCYSCFQVVNRYQAGHYVIHPEFVSEFSR